MASVPKRKFLGGRGTGKSIKKAMAAAVEDFEREVLEHKGLIPTKHKVNLKVVGVCLQYPKMITEVVIVSDVEIPADKEN
jgi:hypothetical protein